MKTKRLYTLATCLVLITPVFASAQTGTRVRLTSELLDRSVRGALIEISANYLLLQPENTGRYGTEPLRLPRSQVTKVEVSTGRKSNWLGGAAIGAGVGALLGLLAWATGPETMTSCTLGLFGPSTCSEVPYDMGFEVVLIGATSTALLGALVGAFIKSDRWEAVQLPTIEPIVSVGAQPDGSGSLRIGLRVRGL